MGEVKAVPAMVARPLFDIHRRQLFLERSHFFVKLVERVDLGEKFLQTLLDNLFRDFFFVEGDQLFDGADALLEVLAEGEQFSPGRAAWAGKILDGDDIGGAP